MGSFWPYEHCGVGWAFFSSFSHLFFLSSSMCAHLKSTSSFRFYDHWLLLLVFLSKNSIAWQFHRRTMYIYIQYSWYGLLCVCASGFWNSSGKIVSISYRFEKLYKYYRYHTNICARKTYKYQSSVYA